MACVRTPKHPVVDPVLRGVDLVKGVANCITPFSFPPSLMDSTLFHSISLLEDPTSVGVSLLLWWPEFVRVEAQVFRHPSRALMVVQGILISFGLDMNIPRPGMHCMDGCWLCLFAGGLIRVTQNTRCIAISDCMSLSVCPLRAMTVSSRLVCSLVDTCFQLFAVSNVLLSSTVL